MNFRRSEPLCFLVLQTHQLVTLWNLFWGDPRQAFIPARLRRQILTDGLRYGANISKALYYLSNLPQTNNNPLLPTSSDAEKVLQVQSADHSEINSSEEPQPKKRRLKPGVRAAMHADEPVPMEIDQQELLEPTRSFLSIGNDQANRIQKLPQHLAVPAAQNQMDKFWIPSITQTWNSVDRFVVTLYGSEEGRSSISRLIQSGALDEEIKKEVPRFTRSPLQRFREQCEELLAKRAPAAMKGLAHSTSVRFEIMLYFCR